MQYQMHAWCRQAVVPRPIITTEIKAKCVNQKCLSCCGCNMSILTCDFYLHTSSAYLKTSFFSKFILGAHQFSSLKNFIFMCFLNLIFFTTAKSKKYADMCNEQSNCKDNPNTFYFLSSCFFLSAFFMSGRLLVVYSKQQSSSSWQS